MNPGLCSVCAATKNLVLIRHPSAEVHYCRECGRVPADSELNWVTLQHFYENELARLNREHHVITSINDLRGWDITDLTRHKPGVVRFSAERNNGGGRERIAGYADDEVFSRLQLPQ